MLGQCLFVREQLLKKKGGRIYMGITKNKNMVDVNQPGK